MVLRQAVFHFKLECVSSIFPGSAKAVTFLITRDRQKSKAFYHEILGFNMTAEDHFAAVFDLNGTMLRISTVKDFKAQPHTVLGWEVEIT